MEAKKRLKRKILIYKQIQVFTFISKFDYDGAKVWRQHMKTDFSIVINRTGNQKVYISFTSRYRNWIKVYNLPNKNLEIFALLPSVLMIWLKFLYSTTLLDC